MQPTDYIKLCLTQKYADFSGRAGKAEFWWFFLFNLIVNIIGELVDGMLGNQILGMLLSLAILVPGLAVGARRLHDINKSGWWQLIALTIIGIFVLIFWWIQDSEAGSNQYGPNPNSGDSEVADHLV